MSDPVTFTSATPRHALPLLFSGQAQKELLEKRDQVAGVSSAKKRESRADLPSPQILPGANSWEQGEVRQLELKKKP